MLNENQQSALTDKIRQVGQQEILQASDQISYHHKTDGSLVTEVDLRVNQLLHNYLQQHFPQTTFLSEEMDREEQQQALNSGQACWCLDPLDGTNNFSSGVPFFAISLALLQQGETVLGMVYDPSRDEFFHAEKNKGASLNGGPLQLQDKQVDMSDAVALLDFKRLPQDFRHNLVSQPPYASQRNFGACALEWCWVAAGRGDLYLHGGQKLWDLAAGSLIFSESGGYSTTFEEEQIRTNTLQVQSVIASPYAGLFEEWQAFVNREINPGPS